MNRLLSITFCLLLGCAQREESDDLRALNALICRYKLVEDIDNLKSKFHVEVFPNKDYLIFKITSRSSQIVSETLSLRVMLDRNKKITYCQSRIEITGP